MVRWNRRGTGSGLAVAMLAISAAASGCDGSGHHAGAPTGGGGSLAGAAGSPAGAAGSAGGAAGSASAGSGGGGGACAASRCPVTLASSAGSPLGMAVDGTSVYWFTASVGGGGDLLKVSLDGTGKTTLKGNLTAAGIAVDASGIYTTDDAKNTILKFPLQGGAPATLANTMIGVWQGQGIVPALAADQANVYWTDPVAGRIAMVPLAGGAATDLVSGGSPVGIARDATSLYWTDRTGGTVMKMPLSGGASTTLASASSPLGIAVDGSDVYFATTDAVMTVPVGGGVAATVAGGQARPFAVAVDATYVYWTDLGPDGAATRGTVMKAARSGGPPMVLASGQSFENMGCVQTLAVDAANVYWINPWGSTDVMRLAKD